MTDRDFLLALKDYFEIVEVQIDKEWGASRELDALIADGEMPSEYEEILSRLATL